MKKSPSAPAIDLSAWRNPPVEYRPAPFWAWNEAQEPRELWRQIKEMRRLGLGGFFMHARVGLKTPYLSEEWFEHVKLSVDEAAQQGLDAWIYDEDRWPSGFAGGQIATVPGLEYEAYALACRQEGGKRRYEVVRAPHNEVFNDAANVDVMNKEVIAAFLHLTHDKYEQAVGTQFAKTVPGTFTDEPSYVLWGSDEMFDLVPWTRDMEAEFQQRRGYEIMPHVDSLFFDEGDYRKIRVDFYRTVTELFVEAFCGQIYDWCRPRKLTSTGHMMMEDNLLSQVEAVGAAMPHYEYMQMPGIDHLGSGIPDSPLLPKQCASVATQLGGRRVLSELFGGAGWEAPIGRLKRVGDWDFAMGVNFLNQHLAYYSIRGARKRDYPAGCCYQSPGYSLYKSFNDYYARLTYLLTRGRAERRVLCLHPIGSAWAEFSPLQQDKVNALDQRFQALAADLLRTQRDFDFGDELIMEKHGSVANGELRVGDGRYQAVVMPAATTWSAATLKLLQDFAAQGGLIVAAEPVATLVDGHESPELAALLAGPAVKRVRRVTPETLDRALAAIPADVRCADEAGQPVRELVYMHRDCGDRQMYFLTCGRRDEAFRAKITVEGTGRVELFDAETGLTTPVASAVEEGRSCFELDFPAQGARLIVVDSGRPAARPAATTVKARVQALSGAWAVQRLDPNTLLLDQARVRVGTSPWSAPMGIFGGANGTCTVPNANDTIGGAVQRGMIWPDWPVSLRFEVAADLPANAKISASLVTEDLRAMSDWRANGEAMRTVPGGWWLDRQFSVLESAGFLRPGRNQFECQVHWVEPMVPGTMIYTPDGTELDNCYLLGDFAVTPQGKNGWRVAPAVRLPSDPSADLTKHGLPFYAGAVRYEKKLKLAEIPQGARLVLKFPPGHGEGLRLSVNGKPVRDLWCAPYEADCTRLLHEGENEIQVDLFSTLGNLLGTTHHRPPWTDVAHRLDGYLLGPLGLGGVPELHVR
ncbi:MAG TPA: glycosyl hydrolase [Armatimonadota bacterium]